MSQRQKREPQGAQIIDLMAALKASLGADFKDPVLSRLDRPGEVKARAAVAPPADPPYLSDRDPGDEG